MWTIGTIPPNTELTSSAAMPRRGTAEETERLQPIGQNAEFVGTGQVERIHRWLHPLPSPVELEGPGPRMYPGSSGHRVRRATATSPGNPLGGLS